MKRLTNITKKLSYLLILAFITVGCATAGSNLEPATSTHKIQMEDAVKITGVDGVNMTVQADAWPSDKGITREVTPIQVTIHNNSDMPVVVSYHNFALITPDGEYHAAIPPFETKGKVDQLELTQHYEPFEAYITYENYQIAPLYDPIYDIEVYVPYEYDFDYYDYYGYWKDIDDSNTELPTGQMLAYAMPEGVILPGGMVKGYLYFQKVEADESDWVKFTAELQNANTGQIFGVISIPYDVISN